MTPPARASILMVDDRADNLLALQEVLRPLDQNLVMAKSGEEALRQLLHQDFAVILLDVQMPGMDGFETAERIKQRERTRDVPIIFLTAISRDIQHHLRGYSVGAVDYISKPYDPWIMRSKVQVFLDLHNKRQLLAAQARELERSNEDLDQFASAVSHDLQEPLRVIAGSIQLLLPPYAEKLKPGQAEQFLINAAESAQQMNQLIRDLLSFARVGRGEASFAPVDAGAALDAALDGLRDAIAQHDATIERSELPTVYGAATLLTQLFHNLVGNAVKFRDTSPTVVAISAEPSDEGWLFHVRDNGIGIDSEDLERVFVIFERLGGRDAYPGTGVGLAICKRIVERHGGRIWVESERGAGTTFWFTLPSPPPAADDDASSA